MNDENAVASVVVPVRNDPAGIRTTLRSLVAQRANGFEIVPVDNASMDGTGDVIESFAREYPDIVNPSKEGDTLSSYAARNAGIDRATGDVILFLDADMWVEESWVEAMATALESGECDYLGCRVEVVAGDSPTLPERYERALSFPVETYLEQKRFAPTCALGVRHEVFERVGRFDERLASGGDKEFGQRVHGAGFDQCYADDVTAYHPARESVSELARKAWRIGRGRAQMRYYHPEVENSRTFHPIYFLPPSPYRLRRRYSGVPLPLRSIVACYFVEYTLKLVQTMGSIREAVAIGGERD